MRILKYQFSVIPTLHQVHNARVILGVERSFCWWTFVTTYHCEYHLTGMFQDPLPVIRSKPVSQSKLQVPGQRTLWRWKTKRISNFKIDQTFYFLDTMLQNLWYNIHSLFNSVYHSVLHIDQPLLHRTPGSYVPVINIHIHCEILMIINQYDSRIHGRIKMLYYSLRTLAWQPVPLQKRSWF